MKFRNIFFLLPCCLLLTACCLFADIPHLISYQGFLTDVKSGAPLTGQHDVVFRLYTSESGGSAIWEETHSAVQLDGGLFNVMLGSVAPFAPVVDFSQPYWLEVGVDGIALSPRYRLGASPYALNVPDALVFADVKNEHGESQFAVTNGDPGIRIKGTGVADVDFDSESHTITISVPPYRPPAGNQPVRGNGTVNYVAKWTDTREIGNSQLFDNGANVGIGTAIPSEKLEIIGNCKADTFFGDGSQLTGIGVNWDTLGAYWDTTHALGMRLLNESDTSIWMDNSLAAGYWSVAFGNFNEAKSQYTVISGGEHNVASGSYSTVGGGSNNYAMSPYSTVGGGANNHADSAYSVVGGGETNLAIAWAFVGGGQGNRAEGKWTTISGGRNNKISIGPAGAINDYSAIGGGSDNTAAHMYATIPGGCGNYVSGRNSYVLGYYDTLTAGYTILLGLPTIVHDSLTVLGTARADTFFGTFSGEMKYPQGSALVLTDATGADTFSIWDDGDATHVKSENVIKFGDSTFYIDPSGYFVGAHNCDVLISSDATSDFGNLVIQGEGPGGGYLYLGRGIADYTTGVPDPGDAGEVLTSTGILPDGSADVYWANASDVAHEDDCTHWTKGTGTDEGVIFTGDCTQEFVGISRGSALNSLIGINKKTHINLGANSMTGSPAGDYMYCTISGGQSNYAVHDYATVSGGSNNQAGEYGTVGGGTGSTATGKYSTVGGGINNKAEVEGSTIGGGGENMVNTIGNIYGTISGGYYNRIFGAYTTIGGGKDNVASSAAATIGGGNINEISAFAYAATIGGGDTNVVLKDLGAICGGRKNRVNAYASFIGGGYNNQIDSTDYCVIGGGHDNRIFRYMDCRVVGGTIAGGGHNTVSGAAMIPMPPLKYPFIGGGAENAIYMGNYATIGGGDSNYIDADVGTIGGGYLDTVHAVFGGVFSGYDNLAGDEPSDDAAFVGGGRWNHAIAKYSAIAGGDTNVASGDYSFIGGGKKNTIISEHSTIAGGIENLATGVHSAICGGMQNHAYSIGGVVGGGKGNFADGNLYSTVGGGLDNWVVHNYGFIGGGDSNFVSGAYSTIGGGRIDTIRAEYGFIGGGYKNHIFPNADTSTIAGGANNRVSSNGGSIGGGGNNMISANAPYSVIGGGQDHYIDGSYSTIGGGRRNTAATYGATIAGGDSNVVRTGSFVGGGYANQALGDYTTIGGGYTNIDSAGHGFIGGGKENVIKPAALYSVIPGGSNNRVEDQYSFAFGNGVIVGASKVAAFYSSADPGKVGINQPTPTSALHIKGETGEGYDQLRLQDQFHPANCNDWHGKVGDIAWGVDPVTNVPYIYVKIQESPTHIWGRAELQISGW